MSYERFVELFKLSSALRRSLHTCKPSERRTLGRALQALNFRLCGCEHYTDYLYRVALSVDQLG